MTKSTETEIAILQTQMQDVKTSLETIKADQHSNFQALALKIDNLSNTPLEISTINDRLTAVEKSKNREWVRNTMSAIVGGVFIALIIYAATKQ